MSVRVIAAIVGLSFVLAAGTAQAAQEQAGQGAAAQAPQKPKPGEAASQKKEPEQTLRFEEQIVVTASKTEQMLANAPATMSVISSQALKLGPAQSYADLFRTVPGLNVSQTSARDINITSRSATGTLATSQLALVDGRSIYQDFFGFVAWDFLPVSMNEVKQIEVIRGPASAIWGANAMSGVVNIITKSPREMQGTSFNIGVGAFNRSAGGVDRPDGTVFYVGGVHAQAINDQLAFKISAGGYMQQAYPRPTGTIPNKFNTPYPPYENSGTAQPKLDGRVDYDFADGKQKLVLAGGFVGTQGIIHTGIGPFQIEGGTRMSYGKVDYSRGPLKIKFFTNILGGKAPALLSVDPLGNPVVFRFDSKTFDVEFSNVQVFGRHVISYGGNFRHNSFDLSIAPSGNSRNEGGVYAQDEIFLSDHFRWVVGGRVDRFDVLHHAVFSPRTTFMIKPTKDNTFRVSFNRAYRAPSLVNNFLDVTVRNELDLGLINPALKGRIYPFPVHALGFEDLSQQSLTAYEIGYTGVIRDRATVSAAVYYNDTKDEVYFTQIASYTSSNVPPGWPLQPQVLDLLIMNNAFGPGQGLPSAFSYRNLGDVKSWGIELGVDALLTRAITAFANYAWQAEPDPSFDISELNLPPKHRFNTGLTVNAGRYFGSMSVNYTSEAYWQDVLDVRFHGPTEPYTLVNAGFGVRWKGDKLVTSIKVTNLGNASVQQHVFGDIIKRRVVADLQIGF